MAGKSLLFFCLAFTLTLASRIPLPKTGGCEMVNAVCKRSPTGTLLRNPSDCGSFCECDGISAVFFKCPAGLHFSTSTNRCEQPEVAGCVPNPPTIAPIQHGCEIVEHLCPSDNIGDVRLLPNPVNCGAYCACDWGKAIWMPCPQGLHFNRALQVCDWPDRANCH